MLDQQTEEVSVMRFKRDWKVVYRDYYILLTGIFLLLLWTIYIPVYNMGRYSSLIILLLPFLALALAGFWTYYGLGYFTNVIILDEKGITFQQRKQPPLQIRWEEIGRIVRTRYIGGKAIVFWDIYGQEIWFYNSRKIEGYILSQHPELKSLFPKENDYRKWQQWDKKLRF